MLLLAIDPGIAGCGAALFFTPSTLSWARYVPGLRVAVGSPLYRARTLAHAVMDFAGLVQLPEDELVVEWPQVYRAGRGRGDPNDLLPLTALAGALAANWRGVLTTPTPREWKGTLNPDVLIERVQARLSREERTRVELPTRSLQHNVWDAVGIGLWRTGRLQPARIIARA